MKTAYKNLEYIEELSLKKEKSNTLKNVFQLLLNFSVLYIFSKIYVDIWRSLAGH
jgi:hypothetical protein